GSATVSATSSSNEIQGLAGTITRSAVITIGPPPLIPGTISTFAGGAHGESVPASTATVCCPHALGFDGSGNLFVSDTDTCRLRRVAGGVLNTFAGVYQQTNNPINDFCAYSGDGASALDAGIDPGGVAVSGSNVYISDTRHCRVRLVSGG